MKCGYYIEKFYSNSSSRVEECEIYGEPLLVYEEDKMYGFKFISVNQDGFKDYSRMYYFGKRYTYNELVMTSENDFIKMMLLENLERKGLKEVIVCDRVYKTFYNINVGDKTIEEEQVDYLVKSSRSIFINQFEFLTMIKEAFEAHNNKVSIVMEDSFSKLVPSKSECYVDDVNVVVREYSLFIDEYLLLNSLSVVNGKTLGIKNKNTYIRLSDALELVKPLYQEYPYLEFIINNFLLELLNNDKDIILGTPKTTIRKKKKGKKRKV